MSDEQLATQLTHQLPAALQGHIPALVALLHAARAQHGHATVADAALVPALQALAGATLTVDNQPLTVGDVTGQGIAIGAGATALHLSFDLSLDLPPGTVVAGGSVLQQQGISISGGTFHGGVTIQQHPPHTTGDTPTSTDNGD